MRDDEVDGWDRRLVDEVDGALVREVVELVRDVDEES